jgi:hypothetical protein
MEQMELFNFYNLDECVNKKKVLKKLNQLLDEGKIDFSVDGEILKLEDLDLSESEVEDVAELLDSNDVFPYLDKEDDDDFYDGYDNYDDEDDY